MSYICALQLVLPDEIMKKTNEPHLGFDDFIDLVENLIQLADGNESQRRQFQRHLQPVLANACDSAVGPRTRIGRRIGQNSGSA